MKKYLCVVMLLLMAALSSAAQSIYSCTGSVTSIAVANDGTVEIVSFSALPAGFYLCQIGVASSGNGWTNESCKAAYATLMAARLSGQQVTIWFNDTLTCSTQPTFNLNNKAYLVQQH